MILGKSYINYNDGLQKLRLKKLNLRRQNICLNFAKKCLKNNKVKHFFNESYKIHKMNKRSKNIFKEKRSRTKRFQQSTIPYMTRLLNNDCKKKKKIIG